MTHQDTTPGAITPAIREFCRQIDPSREPLLVPVRPAGGTASGNPFALLKDHASRHGGGVQYGWTLSEQPGWYLEAEFHGVWVAPTGELVDIAGRADGRTAILFLPDSRRTYRGESLPEPVLRALHEPGCPGDGPGCRVPRPAPGRDRDPGARERVRPGRGQPERPLPVRQRAQVQEVLREEHGPGPRTGAGMRAAGR